MGSDNFSTSPLDLVIRKESKIYLFLAQNEKNQPPPQAGSGKRRGGGGAPRGATQIWGGGGGGVGGGGGGVCGGGGGRFSHTFTKQGRGKEKFALSR